MKRIIFLLWFALTYTILYSQNVDSTNMWKEPKSFTEVIEQLSSDTLIFYYNDSWQLVRPICANIFRRSRFDSSIAFFEGEFVDYYMYDSTKAIEGSYYSGKKEGKFNFYFPNGQLAQTGNYLNDSKNGVWYYFYENGKQKQTLEFQNDEILIKEFWDEDGNKLVESGNGEWFGYDSPEKFIKTYGKVLNGRKNGTWKNVVVSQRMTTNIEKYQEGKFINGKMISLIAGAESYKDTLYCTIEKPLKFLKAEEFRMNRCYNYPKNNWEFASYPGGMENFYKEIRQKLVLKGPLISKGVMLIQTTIDEVGRMTNFRAVSNIGHEFELIQVLQTMSKWTPTKNNGKPTIQPKIIRLEIR